MLWVQFVTFDSHFRRDELPGKVAQDLSQLGQFESRAIGMTNFLSMHAGASFENGLYRIHPVAEMRRWTMVAEEAFPEFRRRIFCFAYDWLGRHFALDNSKIMDGQAFILLLEPGTGQALEIPVSFIEFHEQELVQYRNEALASEFYDSWLSLERRSPSFEECVGYKKPLFLEGSDTSENLEVTNMEVYWSITAQLLAKTRELPDGARIGEFRID